MNKDDYTSTTGHIVFLGKNPIIWSSKKQKLIARSSTEIEYKAIAATVELMWVQNLLSEFDFAVSTIPVDKCDNTGATNLCANPIFHSKAYHFIWEQVQNGTSRVSHVHSSDQLADVLTKHLSRPQLESLIFKIGFTERSPILRGHIRDKDKIIKSN